MHFSRGYTYTLKHMHVHEYTSVRCHGLLMDTQITFRFLRQRGHVNPKKNELQKETKKENVEEATRNENQSISICVCKFVNSLAAILACLWFVYASSEVDKKAVRPHEEKKLTVPERATDCPFTSPTFTHTHRPRAK